MGGEKDKSDAGELRLDRRPAGELEELRDQVAALRVEVRDAIHARDGLPISTRGRMTWGAFIITIATLLADRLFDLLQQGHHHP